MKKGIFLVAAALLVSAHVQAAATPWEKYKTPVISAPESIGKYSNGCLIGGVPLPTEGPGYQVVRLGRTRNYAHPEMSEFLQDLGKKVQRDQLGLMLVADIAMPRGGRFATGHRSHQTGLDADIWLRLNAPELPASKRQKMYDVKAVLMVDRDKFEVNREWTENQAKMIRLAAKDERVARIFAHPAIKTALCETAGNDRDWLRRVRPWYGHDSHFHVRLRCQGKDCVSQNPPPAGDGCGKELKSWYPKPKPKKKPKTNTNKPKKKPVKKKPYIPPPPHKRCQMVLNNRFDARADGYVSAALREPSPKNKLAKKNAAKSQKKPVARVYARGKAAKPVNKPQRISKVAAPRSGEVLPSQQRRSQPRLNDESKQQLIEANKQQIELARQRRAKAIAEQERQRLALQQLNKQSGDNTAEATYEPERQSLKLLAPK